MKSKNMLEFLPCLDGWYVVDGKGDERTFDPIIAWQRVQNDSDFAGGRLFPVTSVGYVAFDAREVLKVPAELLEWDGQYYYRLKRPKKIAGMIV